MSSFRIVFVHGYTDSSLAGWYPGISLKLKELGIDFAVPNLPGGRHPHAAEWLNKIHGVVSEKQKPLILVGHSLGTRAVLLYLEKYRPKVEAVFLIAAFANRIENARKYDGDGYPDFFEHKIDIENIKPLVGKFIVVHSKDDELDYEQGVEIANQLDAKLITYSDRGHFSDLENADEILKILTSSMRLSIVRGRNARRGERVVRRRQ